MRLAQNAELLIAEPANRAAIGEKKKQKEKGKPAPTGERCRSSHRPIESPRLPH
jgi:hypothetical protein